jgi:hypothetical protein
MSFRFLVVVALALTAFAGISWLVETAPLYALMRYDGEDWNAVARGWEILYGNWFFILPGAVFSFVLLFFLSGWAYSRGEEVDHARALALQKSEFDRLEQNLHARLTAAERRAESAEQEATNRYKASKAEADRRSEQALEEIKKGRSLQMAASERVKAASEEVKYASQEVRRAEKKKSNAMGAAERIKRREKRHGS